MGRGLGWAKGTTVRRGPDPHGRGTFEGDDVGISPHAVDQRSDWPAAEAVDCHVKFTQ